MSEAREALEEANEEFDRLVGLKSKAELLEKLERVSKSKLQDLICIGGRKPKGGDTERVPDFWD